MSIQLPHNSHIRLRAVSFALKSVLYERQSHEGDIRAAKPRAASSVGGRVGEERKERLPCFHTAFLKPFDSSHQ